MKIHIRDTKTQAKDFRESPHIVRAINEGNWSLCHQYVMVTHIRETAEEATCCRCLELARKGYEAARSSYANGWDMQDHIIELHEKLKRDERCEVWSADFGDITRSQIKQTARTLEGMGIRAAWIVNSMDNGIVISK
jgi:hypothetical protein